MGRALTPLALAFVSVLAAVFSTSHFYESEYETWAWLTGFTSFGLAVFALVVGVRSIRAGGQPAEAAAFGAVVAWSAAATLGALVVVFWFFVSVGSILAGSG